MRLLPFLLCRFNALVKPHFTLVLSKNRCLTKGNLLLVNLLKDHLRGLVHVRHD